MKKEKFLFILFLLSGLFMGKEIKAQDFYHSLNSASAEGSIPDMQVVWSLGDIFIMGSLDYVNAAVEVPHTDLGIQLLNNPATDKLNAKWQSNKQFQYDIYDTAGQLKMNGISEFNSASISIDELSAGIYFIRFYSKEDPFFQTLKFIKL